MEGARRRLSRWPFVIPRQWLPACLVAGSLVALTVHIPAQEPAPAPAPSAEKVRPQVQSDLDATAKAREKGDAKGALGFASRAHKRAKESLPKNDPLFVRAALTLAELRCADASEKGETGGVLDWADYARRTAENAGELPSALKWADYANRFAERSPEAEVGTDRRARLLLIHARLLCRSAIAADDLQRARDGGKPDSDGLSKARVPTESALADTSKALPPEDPERVRTLLALTDVQFRLGDRAAALESCRAILQATEAAPKDLAEARVEALLIEARLRLDAGEAPATVVPGVVAEAESLLPPGNPLDAAAQVLLRETLWNPLLAGAYQSAFPEGAATAGAIEAGTFEKVEAKLEQDLSALERSLDSVSVSPPIAALGRLGLARFQFDSRRIGRCEETLAKLEPSMAEPRIAATFRGDFATLRGLVATERAEYAVARDRHEEAFRIYREAGLPQQALALNNIGLLLLRQGDYGAAREVLQTVVDFYASQPALRDDPQRVFAMTNLAKALEGADDYFTAVELHQGALEIAQKATPPNPYAACSCLNNLGINYYNSGFFKQAGEQFEAARSLASRTFGAEHFHVAETDANLGWVALATGDPAGAEKRFRAALESFRASLGQDHPRTAEIQGYLGRVLAGSGRKDEARETLEEALKLRNAYLSRLLGSPLSERDRLALVQELRVHPESSAWPGVLDTYLDLAPTLGIDLEAQYREVLAWKGILARHAPPPADELESDEKIRALARRREELLRSLRTATFSTSGAKRDLKAEAEIEELERSLRVRSPRFQRGAEVPQSSPDEIAGVLDSREALLDVIEIRRYRPREEGEPLEGDLRYAAFVVRPAEPLARIDLEGEATEINDAVEALRTALERDAGDDREPAARLDELIRKPLLPFLANMDTLIVAGDDRLHFLPLSALPGEKPGSYWAADLTFATVPTAQSLELRRRRESKPEGGMVLVGGVDYGPKKKVGDWTALPETKAEAEAVGGLFRKTHPRSTVKLLIGSKASKHSLLEQMPQCRFVHLATHGFFRDDARGSQAFSTYSVAAQFDSGVVLAGANQAGTDAQLTAEEMGNLDLRGADLVTLSACESGLGHVRAGQGVIGLVGALDRAGASAVVCSLWKVDDEATALLMRSFYGHLWEDKAVQGPAAALRAAQLDLIRGKIRRASGQPLDHPRFWAPFLLVGDPLPPKQD